MSSIRKRSAFSLVALLGGLAAPASAAPLPHVARPHDLGSTDPAATVTTSIYLRIHDAGDLAQRIQATVTPGSPQYRHFLSVDQFVQRYAPSNERVRQITGHLQRYGITINEVYRDHLVIVATGTVAQFNAALATSVREYDDGHHRYHRPATTPQFPSDLATDVLGVGGLSNEHGFHHRVLHRFAEGATAAPVALPAVNNTATGVPGSYTVGDVANLYQVNPLYRAGATGRGQTVGIATLAGFDPADAYAYWSQIGLNVRQDRITQVHVDGGAPIGPDVGSDETTLDVQQSGGLAPGANVVVYDAPNTDNGFQDVFYRAVSDNTVDTLSVSWGQAESFYFNSLLTGADYTYELTSFHQVFMEAAVQGISVFAASGDHGAYDVNEVFPYPQFSTLLSVDSPASDPYVTAAGGTTVAATLQRAHGTITIPQERAWGWDYLRDYIVGNYGLDVYYGGVYLVGDGGGVSTFWGTPSYQSGLHGARSSSPGQSLLYYPNYPDLSGAQDVLDLPANFAGRNLPDVSLNADPETGYLVYYAGAWGQAGGTSFVAPQLNGIVALVDQAVGSRVGFLNPQLYRLAASNGYGPTRPFNDITAGNNWGYDAAPGFEPATGIGTLNATNLAVALGRSDR